MLIIVIEIGVETKRGEQVGSCELKIAVNVIDLSYFFAKARLLLLFV
jgi:hypothetical protein